MEMVFTSKALSDICTDHMVVSRPFVPTVVVRSSNMTLQQGMASV